MAYKDFPTPERSGKFPTLLEAARALNDVERAHCASVMIDTGPEGYRARFSISLYLPHGAPRSAERMEWVARMVTSPYSAKL